MKVFMILVVCLLVSVATAHERWFFEFETNEIDTLWIQGKKKMMDNFFQEQPIEWNQEGTFLFVDIDSFVRLFQFVDGVVKLNQYPRPKVSQWINPERYLKEREDLALSVPPEKCYQSLQVEEKNLSISQYDLSKIPNITPLAPCFYESCSRQTVSNVGKKIYFGFQRKNGKQKYFLFKDFREKGMKINPPLDKFENFLVNLNQYPFSIELEECR